MTGAIMSHCTVKTMVALGFPPRVSIPPRVDIPPGRHPLCRTACCVCHVRAQSLLTGVIPSYRSTWADVDYRPPSQGCRVPGSSDLLRYGRLRSLGDEPTKGESAHVKGGSPATIVITMIMRALVEEFLCQGLIGWRPVLKCLSARCAWVPVPTSRHARP
jgi:hypothetical protein